MILYNTIDQCLVKLSSEKFPPEADWKKYIYRESVWRMRDFGTLHPKWVVFIKFFYWKLREIWRRGCRKSVRNRGDKGHQESKTLFNQHDPSSYHSQDWSRMHRVNMGLQQVGPLHLNYAFQFSVLMGYLGVQISRYQILVPFLGGSFFLLFCLVQSQCDDFCFTFFILLY